MKPRNYRQRLEAEMAEREAAAGAPGRAAEAPEPYDAGQWPRLIERLRDASASSEERAAALKALQAATFLGDVFDDCRADYVAALREIVADPDLDLRRRALDILASMKDDFARERIMAGLTGRAEPLIAPAVALGLLARDDHASASAIARQFLERASDRFTRAQAVRLLSRDPAAKAILERLMASKEEFREVRQASAAALRNLDPQAFIGKARQILDDASDFKEIHETLRHALHRSGLVDQGPPQSPGMLASALAWVRGLFGRRGAGPR